MEHGLHSSEEEREVKISDGERLMIFMLCDLFKNLKLNSEIEPEFVEKVIYGGHYWALAWKYPGIFHRHEDSKSVLYEVVEILDMWSFLEDGYAMLSKKDKDFVATEAVKHVQFRGFDGNGESEYIGIARFMVEQLDRFAKFKGRDFDAHMPTLETYRRMLAVFGPIRRTMMGRNLKTDEIIKILKAMLHPSRQKD